MNIKYDLEERTKNFAKNIIGLMMKLPQNSVNKRMVEQLIGSGGSVGANYCEANEAESKKDFTHKIGICKKEIKETRYWLNLLSYANPNFKDQFKILSFETQELLLIFSKIISSCRKDV
ncbi:four helix bundle protein [Candidatus Roizmanbacteria bacterium CG22_combo_CG10-13_8_21_14_all_35_9]|uniref:Four helix bundle protein n=3 Tax=Candidatus Roizmaniibacteriota TaxID=1752723 RepID=A0A2H0BZ22_9BACT|nr:MAG: four helix bundle protein [Candidatus Roizmanbacteria bacterium CG23_combo_of_CG06-09_8_20_14_all_35_49]PIP62946.1 MAG: four helix bundle protein [Candidatus Roizmanbacteria bacterium CG22_combo_CG10-13_8_21_14_all_35_9]PIY71337.1 MAG: four helix bundle protein [Candidatus Roizmanbacteria bacterium CG_4_10_14_0_8_um_filter_35_28]PJC83159.1 MAG: four helix bundle protein [Candidatus Roizmanbacteria bacterium CG_4_8_14_3_um_filter_35_14]